MAGTAVAYCLAPSAMYVHAMKIAVTSQDSETVTDHAGRCRTFWVYDTEFAEIRGKQLLELGETFRDALPGALDDINVLITGGLAGAMRYRLKQQGIQAVATLERDPDRAVASWLDGTLDEIPPLSHLGGLH